MVERIGLEDTTMSAIMKLAGSNPGAMKVCMMMLDESGQIDPDGALGGFGALLSLDSNGIYGDRIWMLYKDVCKEDLIKMVAVLRSKQLGLLSGTDLNHAIDNYGDGLDLDSLYSQVKKILPAFDVGEIL